MFKRGLRTPASSRRGNRSLNYSSRRLWTSFNRSRSLLIPDNELEELETKTVFDNHLRGTYNASRVSPMFGFKYRAQALSKYKKRLIEMIVDNGDNSSQDGTDDKDVEVNIQVLKELKSRDSGFEAVAITIEQIDNVTQKKTSYQCVLCSIDPLGPSDDIQSKDFVVLPLMLWKGSRILMGIVENFFTQYFKCSMWALNLRPIDLEWLAVMFCVNEDHPAHLHLIYGSSYKELNTIKYIVDMNNVISLVRSVVDADAEELTFDSVKEVMGIFKRHFLGLTCIDLDHFYLKEIKTAGLDASVTGKIRIKHHEQLWLALRFYTSIAESLLYDYNG